MESQSFGLIFAFVVAFLMAFGATPIVRNLAFKIGAVDVPKDARRVHKVPVARLGGLAIFYGFIVSYLVFNDGIDLSMLGILLGSAIIVTLGIFDDIYQLRAWVKLLFQIAAAVVVVSTGTIITTLTNPNIFSATQYIDFHPVVGGILTVVWIVGVTNAINLIDGIDGLAAGVSSIASIAIFFIALILSEPNVALVTACIAGACFGFLPFNFNPAKIFMGDTGAMFLGFILASVSVTGLIKSYAAISFVVPIIILGLPLFDTSFAILRRLMRGEHIMTADRKHVHHRLIDAGFTQKQAVILLYVMSAMFALAGVLMACGLHARAGMLIVAVLIIIFAGILFKVYRTTDEEAVYMRENAARQMEAAAALEPEAAQKQGGPAASDGPAKKKASAEKAEAPAAEGEAASAKSATKPEANEKEVLQQKLAASEDAGTQNDTGI